MSLEVALTTLEEMLSDRGYAPVYTNRQKVDIVERMFDRVYVTPSNKYALVIIVEATADIKAYGDQILDDEYETIVCVYNGNSNVAHRTVRRNLDKKIELWSVNMLLVNIMKHFMQPKVELCPGLKQSDFNGRLPKMSVNDPVAMYYRFPSKSVIRVTTESGDIHYRVVV